jgi:hypothetical protein
VKPNLARGKVGFSKAKFSPIKNVRFLSWEDAFDVEFEDGLCILEPHATIRKANHIAGTAKFDHLEMEDWCHAGFNVHYDNGQVAEVSWSFIRELPPTPGEIRALHKRSKGA